MSDKPVDDGWRIPDALWEQIEPLLPPKRSYPKGGRPRMPDRQAMDAIFYVLAVSGRHYRAVWEHPARYTTDFRNGERQVSLSACRVPAS